MSRPFESHQPVSGEFADKKGRLEDSFDQFRLADADIRPTNSNDNAIESRGAKQSQDEVVFPAGDLTPQQAKDFEQVAQLAVTGDFKGLQKFLIDHHYDDPKNAKTLALFGRILEAGLKNHMDIQCGVKPGPPPTFWIMEGRENGSTDTFDIPIGKGKPIKMHHASNQPQDA